MYDSLESVCEEFGLPKNLTKAKLRSELKKRAVSIHADKTGGEFPSLAVKQLYLRIQDALAYLDRPTQSNALVKGDPAANALEIRIAALEASKSYQNQSYEDSALQTAEKAGSRYRGTWITSGVFAAVFAAVIPFSQKLSQNPLFSWVANALWIRILATCIFALSGLGFVFTEVKELKLERKVSALLSEDGIAWVLRECINKYNEEPECTLTKRKMIGTISKCGSRWHRSKAARWLQERFGNGVPHDLAEKIAKLQLSSLIERGILRQDGTRGIEPVFALDAAVAKEIVEDHGAILFEHELR